MGDRKKAKTPKKDDPEQSKRFVETARKLGSDQSGAGFDKALESITNKRAKPR